MLNGWKMGNNVLGVDLELREFTLEDAGRVRELLDDPSVSRWTRNIPYPYTRQNAIDWITASSDDPEKHPFAVTAGEELLACVSYWPEGEDIEVGYWVGRDYWGQGVGTRALRLLLERADFPHERRVVARVKVGNERSERVLQKCGFEFSEDCLCPQDDDMVDARLFVRTAD